MSRIRNKSNNCHFLDVRLYVTPDDVTSRICQNCLRSHGNFSCPAIEMDVSGISNGADHEVINMLEQTIYDSSLLQVRLLSLCLPLCLRNVHSLGSVQTADFRGGQTIYLDLAKDYSNSVWCKI